MNRDDLQRWTGNGAIALAILFAVSLNGWAIVNHIKTPPPPMAELHLADPPPKPVVIAQQPVPFANTPAIPQAQNRTQALPTRQQVQAPALNQQRTTGQTAQLGRQQGQPLQQAQGRQGRNGTAANPAGQNQRTARGTFGNFGNQPTDTPDAGVVQDFQDVPAPADGG